MPLPVIFSYHGFYDEAIDMQKIDKLMHESEAAAPSGGGFIAVHPQGLMDCGRKRCQVPYPQRTWNCGGTSLSPGPLGPTCVTNRSQWGVYPCYTSCRSPLHGGGCKDTCCSSTCANDTLFFESLLGQLESTLCIDRRRVHVTGISNGGMMAYQLAQTFSSLLASAVPTAGSALL